MTMSTFSVSPLSFPPDDGSLGVMIVSSITIPIVTGAFRFLGAATSAPPRTAVITVQRSFFPGHNAEASIWLRALYANDSLEGAWHAAT